MPPRSSSRRRSAETGAGLWRSWRRFQVARGTGLLLSVAMFPIVAPLTGPAVAYWGLVVAASAVNYCADKHWCFSGPQPRGDHVHLLPGAGPAADRQRPWLPAAVWMAAAASAHDSQSER